MKGEGGVRVGRVGRVGGWGEGEGEVRGVRGCGGEIE